MSETHFAHLHIGVLRTDRIEIPSDIMNRFAGRTVSITIRETGASTSGELILAGAGTEIWLPIYGKFTDKNLLPLLSALPCGPFYERKYGVTFTKGVKAILVEPLIYTWVKGRAGRSRSGKCLLMTPAGEHGTVNKAYTAASRYFETKRESNTANIYSKAFIVENGKHVTLGELRDRALTRFAEQPRTVKGARG